MIIKNKSKSGKRTICTCINCGVQFSELDIKIRNGGGKFCSLSCYNEYRTKNKKDEKELNRYYQKKNKYGLSKDDYLLLYHKQNNKCAICGDDITCCACVDHDHKTGKVRGLLCGKCNTLLGFARDNIEILKRCIEYLEQNKQMLA